MLLALVSCAQHPSPVVSAPAAPAERVVPEAVQWVRNSAEFHAALYQVYRLATTRVEQAVARRPAGSWAVILDADETVLNNSLYQLERSRLGLGFTAESWNAWVKRREATPLPGAAGFLNRVRALGGRIAIVTNRLESECADTRAVFDAFKLAYDAMLCRPDGSPSDKNPRFAAVAEGRSPASTSALDVVAVLGDNIMDFPAFSQKSKEQGAPAFADFGVRYFLVPNPMYGSWQ
ncbi:MAG: outer membrane protein [Acidobacteriota bacterium]|jgi:5'-nucleotidase (lipoprotein e(P4) family)